MKQPSSTRGVRFWLGFFWVFCAVLFAALAVLALVATVYYPPDLAETPYMETGFWPFCLLGLVCWGAALVALERRGRLASRHLRALRIALAVYALLLGAVWAVATADVPNADPALIAQNAANLLRGDAKMFGPLEYFSQFPFQTGFGLLLTLFYRLFGSGNNLAYQLFNALCCPVSFFFVGQCTHRMFHSERTDTLVTVLSFGCLPVLLLTPYVYGNLVSLALGFAALDRALAAMQEGRVRQWVLCGVCLALAQMAKPNTAIFLIAVVLMLLLHALQQRSVRTALAALALAAVCLLANDALLRGVEAATGYDLHSGAPRIGWVAMGLQEGPLAPGWFNSYTDILYTTNAGDSAAISAAATENIKASLLNFARSPGFALRFFGEKTITQWCEPTYGCFWASNPLEAGEGRDALPAAVLYCYFGGLHDAIVYFLDIFQFVLYFGAAVCLWQERKRLSPAVLLCAVIVVGGFVYHTFAEGKSLYQLPYLLCMLPYAAQGYALAAQQLAKKLFR